jgi:hypothetical protein
MGIVRVACTVINGLLIRNAIDGVDDGTGDGVKQAGHGPAIRLNGPSARDTGVGATDRRDLEPGITEVDEDFMTEWLRQNAKNPFVVDEWVYVVEHSEVPNAP